MLELPPLPPAVRTLTNDEREWLLTRHPDVPSSPEHCVTCKGKGSFLWWDSAARDLDKPFVKQPEIVEFKCPCLDQWILHRYLLFCGLGLSYQRMGWADVEAEQGAVDKARNYLERLPAYIDAGCGLILYGGNGTGKTLLATLILKTALAYGYDGYFTTFSEMLDTYASAWRSEQEKAWFFRRIKNVPFLVLDDPGKEMKGRLGMPESTFDEVLRHRVAGSKPTLITTNYTMEKLQEGYGGSVMSLLHERSTTYRFTGGDWRDNARLRLDAEVERGLTRPVVLG